MEVDKKIMSRWRGRWENFWELAVKGGPPVRGTKLTAWQIPPVYNDLRESDARSPEGSSVLRKQKNLQKATDEVLRAIAADVRSGLLETIGIESEFSTDGGRCSMVLELPEGTDAQLISRAIDAENVESWLDENNKVRVAVNPWYSTKDVDQTVLSTIKVIHVLLGIHATDDAKPKTFKEKLIKSISDIMELQKSAKK